jgi:hypothetical protein
VEMRSYNERFDPMKQAMVTISCFDWILSEMPPLATKAQVGESLFHEVVSQMTNARFDLRWRHSLSS